METKVACHISSLSWGQHIYGHCPFTCQFILFLLFLCIVKAYLWGNHISWGSCFSLLFVHQWQKRLIAFLFVHIFGAASEGVLLNLFTHTIVVVIMGAGHFLYCGNPWLAQLDLAYSLLFIVHQPGRYLTRSPVTLFIINSFLHFISVCSFFSLVGAHLLSLYAPWVWIGFLDVGSISFLDINQSIISSGFFCAAS